jgi:hypothetical protein
VVRPWGIAMSRKSIFGLVVLAVILTIGGLLFRFELPGLSSARPAPPTIEIALASWLLVHSVPAEEAQRANPLEPNEAGLAAGAALFQQNCAGSAPSSVRSDTVNSTREFLGQILGAGRGSVSLVAITLQQAALIRYGRGTIEITSIADGGNYSSVPDL